MIKDYNELSSNTVFHFKNSLRPFVRIFPSFYSFSNKEIFIDVSEGIGYVKEDLNFEGLSFYTKEDNEIFEGVEVAGTLKDWL